MKSRTTARFWRLYVALPPDVQEHALRAYRQFQADPSHPGLQFKRVSQREPIYSARIGLAHRVVGRLDGDTILWFWIGPHDDYDRLLRG